MFGSRYLVWLVVVAVCVALVGCAARTAGDGGAAGRRPDKGRKDAETQALQAVNGAADALAKALPELRREPEPPAELVREQRAHERLGPAVRGLGGLVAVMLAGFLFLRLDDRTQRTRTPLLAFAAVVLAAGGVAAAVFV